MPYVPVTICTARPVSQRLCVHRRTHDARMALHARLHGDSEIVTTDPSRILELSGGKFKSVHESVVGLVKIFKINIFGRVTGITGRHMMVTGSVPALVLVAHDVTIETGLRIIRKIGVTFPLNKGK